LIIYNLFIIISDLR